MDVSLSDVPRFKCGDAKLDVNSKSGISWSIVASFDDPLDVAPLCFFASSLDLVLVDRN